jgi:N-acyl-D-amino-acid deacylase
VSETARAELVFRDATVVDGTGRPARVASVAVRDGRIAEVGPEVGTAERIIDATGLVLAPGFIDIHTHSDVSLILDPSGESKLLQGVTTEVTGNCGFSPFPLTPRWMALHEDHLHRIGDGVPNLSWVDLDGYAAVLAASPPALNVAPLIGHGTLRLAVMGVEQREAAPAELDAMRQMLARDLAQGAFGFSTGLTHVPSAYGDEREVTALIEVVAEHDALYATHMRSSGTEMEAVEEALRSATSAGARLQISHAAINHPDRWGRASAFVALIEDARRRGLDVGFDVYPYDASSSSLTQYLPAWVQDGGTEAMRARLAEPQVRARAEQEFAAGWFGGIPWLWDRVQLCRTGPGDEWCIGLTIAAAAASRGVEPAAFALELCLEHGNAAGVVLFYRTEDDVRTFLAHPLAVVGSDGSAVPFEQGEDRPHPRGFGTYPRVLGRYVRDQQLLSLPTAIHKMTGAVADRLQLSDRGWVRPGLVADLVVFDPATVIDTATFTSPAQPPVGIRYVVVNGQLAVDDAVQTPVRAGSVLRRPPQPGPAGRAAALARKRDGRG